MPRFFLEEIDEEITIVYGEDAKHITRSLRMREGEQLTLCDTQGTDFLCKIERLGNDAVQVRILEKQPSKGEPACKVRLYQALPKGDKLEYIVQKSTELGVDEIVPVVTDRCISRPNARAMEKRHERLQKIACEAAKQSERGQIPKILPLLPYDLAIKSMCEAELGILFYEESREHLGGILHKNLGNISIMVGCEGGFASREVQLAEENGIHIASLGNRILRCETAPLCALSAIMFYMGEF